MHQQHQHQFLQSKFKSFLESLNIEACLHEALLEGYYAIFNEGASDWSMYGTGDTAGPGKFRVIEPNNAPGHGLYSKPAGESEITLKQFQKINAMPIAGAPLTPRAFGTQPMGSYDAIFKQVPEGPGLTGDVPTPGNNYSYNIPIQNTQMSTRDIGEETQKDWGKEYKFPRKSWSPEEMTGKPKSSYRPEVMTNKLMKKAKGHLPLGQNVPNLAPPAFTNFNLPNFGMDVNNQSASIGSPGP